MNTVIGPHPTLADHVYRVVSPLQLRIAVATSALFVAALTLLLAAGPPGGGTDASNANVLAGAQAATPGADALTMPVLRVDTSADITEALATSGTDPASAATSTGEATEAGQPGMTGQGAAPDPASPAPTPAPAPAADSDNSQAPEKKQEARPEPEPDEPPSVGAIKSKADEKGYDVHGHVEHSVLLLGQQVLIPGQAATGGFIQTGENSYMAYSPVTAMLPVAIQDNKEVLERKPDLEGDKLYRKLAQEYTGSNDYKNLDRDAQRAINILTCTDWSLVDKRVRENTINHLLHSPISFGTIGSVDDPISTDVTIDLGYTHTRDKNWTEVEYMGNNVYKVTVVSNNNNGSHTGHAMGTAYVEMPAGTSLREAQKIGNEMIPSTNKNNKLTIDPAARDLFHALPRGASPLILFQHLSEAEQNAYFEGRGIETVGQPNPDCNPLDGGILGSTPAPAADEGEAPADQEAPAEEPAPSTDDQAPPADPAAPSDDQAPAEATDGQAPAEDGDGTMGNGSGENPTDGQGDQPPAESSGDSG